MEIPLGIILGSGWGKILENLHGKKEKSFKQVFGTSTSVPGHENKVIEATLNSKKVIFLSGRLHIYEGLTANESAETVRYLYKQGVRKIIITSAVGALNPLYHVGDLVVLSDLLTIFSPSPLSGATFQDMSAPFSNQLIKAAEKTCVETGLTAQKGVHAFMRGPHYETFADKKALRILGADVVGMSMAPEVIMAKNLGMEILGLALVTNLAFVKHSHKEVLAAAENQEKKLKAFLIRLIEKI